MKVLQINNCHFPRGGADVVYLNTGNLLEKNGNEVYYFSIKNELNEKNNFNKYFVDEVNFLRLSLFKKILNFFRFFYSVESSLKLSKLLNDFSPDIAHVHLYKGGLTPSILKVLKQEKIPILITLHDYGLLDPHNLLLDGNLKISERCINGSAFNCVKDKSNRNSYLLSLVSTLEYIFHINFYPFSEYFDTIVCVSKFSKNLHLKSHKFNLSIDHLYNFSPLANILFETQKNNSEYILYFGRLSKEKGIKTLIKAVEKIDHKIVLKIVGTGILKDELENYIKNNNINNITLLGFKKGIELHDLIKKSKYVIVPSEWYENNPMTVIESYCFGVPVIGSRIGGIPEIIEEGKTGFTYEMGNIDDLVRVLKKGINLNECDYLKLKNNARNFAKNNFSPANHYKELIKLYSKTINKLRFNDK